ncbi:MAG: cupin domain-containing protein [Ginsengibacter sp.]
MKKNVKLKLLLFILPIVFIACSEGDKETSTDSTTDSTKSTIVDSSAKTQTMDAVSVAPNRYQVVKDSMGIRILKIIYKPGDSSAMHSHPDNVLYVIDGGKSQFTMQDGSKQVYELKAGTTMILPAATHSVKNVGTATTNAILVEVHRPNTPVIPDPTLDAIKVAPQLYKLVKDTMNIRVLMANYKPGASSAMHAHPDNAIYIIEGGSAEFTDKDGKKQTLEMGKGTGLVMPAQQHGVKNTGKGNLKVLIVEVNRPER